MTVVADTVLEIVWVSEELQLRFRAGTVTVGQLQIPFRIQSVKKSSSISSSYVLELCLYDRIVADTFCRDCVPVGA